MWTALVKQQSIGSGSKVSGENTFVMPELNRCLLRLAGDADRCVTLGFPMRAIVTSKRFDWNQSPEGYQRSLDMTY
jgi:hypothetical protein